MSEKNFPALIVEHPVNKEEVLSLSTLKDPQDIPNSAGGMLVRVTHSSLNFKDALAVTGRGKVLRKFPIVPGIDLAGIVEAAPEGSSFDIGDAVLVTGFGLGESYSGGYSRYATVSPDWALPIPAGLTAAQCMALGTAGFTAALSIIALEKHGLSPKDGPVVVSGATGGVGSIALKLLSAAGFEVAAASGRIDAEAEYLRSLGATELIHRDELSSPDSKPLEREKWAAAIDSVGGTTLANILAHTRYGRAVAACGLAGGHKLPTTVFPFILRGVALLGIDSVMSPMSMRKEAWKRLATDIPTQVIEAVSQQIPLGQVACAAAQLLDGQLKGRIVVSTDPN